MTEDFDDFFDNAINGFLTTTPGGDIIRANKCIAQWIGCTPDQMKGARIADFLTIAGKVYYETNLNPLLHMQGFFDEVALELSCKDGSRLPVVMNAVERGGVVRTTIFRSADRRQYERNILEARRLALASATELRLRVADEVKERMTVEANLMDERHSAALREQFIAVLGHDLRNPLASIAAGMRALNKRPLDETARGYTALIEKSVGRMAGLIDNVMDFARGRLGGGINLSRATVDLVSPLTHVVEELRLAWPERRIETEFSLPHPINCDVTRICQLLSNLTANALSHGAPDGPVYVRASGAEGLEISVSNTGNPISGDVMKRLFQPFTRDEVRPSQQGLGLGLYIAAEIARAHGGRLTATSNAQETRFTFCLT